jgi:hypothetical protein
MFGKRKDDFSLSKNQNAALVLYVAEVKTNLVSHVCVKFLLVTGI